jgi:hypothetical protein
MADSTANTKRAIRVVATVDEAIALAIPALRPLLGKRVELVVVHSETGPSPSEEMPKLTVDELLAARLKPPAGVGPVCLDDMEEAIERGATGAVR